MEGRRDHAVLSEAEFLDWAEPRDGRFELVEDAVVPEIGATIALSDVYRASPGVQP